MPPETRQLRVLIVRMGAMGDILHALPAVAALRAVHPGWRIGWAVGPQWQALLRAASGPPASDTSNEAEMRSETRGPWQPVVDTVHLAAAKEWARQPLRPGTFRDISRLRRELRGQHYDLCIDLQGTVRSALVGRAARAPRMVGEDDPRERLARWFFNERTPTTGRHVIEQAMEVVEAAVGEQLPPVPAQLPWDAKAEAWCDAWLSANSPGKFVQINPGASWGAKRWPPARYGAVAAAFHAQGHRVILNAGPGEASLAAEVARASGGAAVPVSSSLGELISLTRRAALVIAGDTGPLHLANALGRPVVGIFGPTDPTRNGPFGGEFRVLRHPESRRDHSRRSEPEAGLLTISVDAVLAASWELLLEGNRAGDRCERKD